tara:strand:+ start:23716 stop:24234 length:519 start_codon:yes stop_codon:yes gene_type:complete
MITFHKMAEHLVLAVVVSCAAAERAAAENELAYIECEYTDSWVDESGRKDDSKEGLVLYRFDENILSEYDASKNEWVDQSKQYYTKDGELMQSGSVSITPKLIEIKNKLLLRGNCTATKIPNVDTIRINRANGKYSGHFLFGNRCDNSDRRIMKRIEGYCAPTENPQAKQAF